MKLFLRGALALAAVCALGLTAACQSTSAGVPSTTSLPPINQVTFGQLVLGVTMAADTGLKGVESLQAAGQLPSGSCAVVKAGLPDASAGLSAAATAWNVGDQATTADKLTAAMAFVPELQAIAATGSLPKSASSPKPSAATIIADVATLLPSILQGVGDAAAVKNTNTVPALQSAIPNAVSQFQADASGFACS